MRPCHVAPALTDQLAAARADESVEAVLLLRQDVPAGAPPDDIAALMLRASGQDAAAEMNYMPRIGALIVRAHSQVIRMLIDQPEVELASANQITHDTYL